MCTRCGFLFYRDVFDETEIKKLYSTEGRYETAGERNMKPGRKRELARISAFMGLHVPFDDINSIIDVGAGDFEVLNQLMSQHPGKRFVAIDPSYRGDKYKTAEVLRDMVEESTFTERHDLVMITHVLEHVVDLHVFMGRLLPLVKKYVYVEVPFQVGPALLLTRSANSQHINYFTPDTLRSLLERYGLKIEKICFENDWYKYNGMAGMIRVVATRTEATIRPRRTTIWQAMKHLLSPWPFIKSFTFTK